MVDSEDGVIVGKGMLYQNGEYCHSPLANGIVDPDVVE
jgi:hypothetical protein